MLMRRRTWLTLAVIAIGAFIVSTSFGLGGSMVAGENGTCLACHSDAGRLMSLLSDQEDDGSEDEGGGCAQAPSRPAFLNYFVKAKFADSVHGQMGCTSCHNGDPTADDLETAHADMTPGGGQCANCHGEIAELHETSLHATLAGQDRWLRMRAGTDENWHDLETMRRNDCNTCHGGCSDCHITIPSAVGGGLLSGHEFQGTPPMEDTCGVCHASRAGNEFMGKINDSIPADVHFQAGITCLDCHNEPMHGDGTAYESRWKVDGLPQCTDCHDALPNDGAMAHNGNHADVSCQSCHGNDYNNCFSCHSSIDDEGEYHRMPDRKEAMFKIGLNTVPDYPYDYVPVRHNPVARDSFNFFGENLLPNFDEYPTWKTAAPHNITTVTPRNESCGNCHNNPDVFLMDDDLDPDDSEANTEVTVDETP